MIKNTRRLIFAIGLYKVGGYFGYPLYHSYNYYYGQQPNLKEMFTSESSYVAVTGCTEGIGKGIVEAFTQQGFNTLLLSRNPQKLETQSQLMSLQNVKSEPRVIDFASANNETYNNLFTDLRDKDISILVNNVGIGTPSGRTIFSNDPQDIENIIKTNIFSQVMMTKKYLEKIKQDREEKQSMIIHLSSIVGDFVNPFGTAYYQGTKKFNKIFARNIYYPSGVYYLIIKPGWVSTPLTGNRDISWNTASIQEEARAILQAIGFTQETHAQPKHLLVQAQLALLPMHFVIKYAKNKQHQKWLAENEKKGGNQEKKGEKEKL